MDELQRTCLYDTHLAHGARMVPFAGYEMAVQYRDGVLKEHLHTRAAAGLFDVSHMGQVLVRPGAGGMEEAARALEALMPVSVAGLAEGRQRYGLLTNEEGGIRDDLMFANKGDHFLVVVNAACKGDDIAHLRAGLPGCVVEEVTTRALVALQGPRAEAALGTVVDGIREMRFMDVRDLPWSGETLWVSRSGYTGEDGFEISIPEARAVEFTGQLLAQEEVKPIGLGARDSLRLEAGMCLYGSDIDTTTSPVEAGLDWAIQKVRRTGGSREGGFPGAARILRELEEGPARLRVGLRPEGRAPMRAGVKLYASEDADEPVGSVTSGAFAPSLGAPVAMGYVSAAQGAPGTPLWGEVRAKRLPVTVSPMPFHPTSYKR